MEVLGVIPARYGSSRFPGKPLVDICGKPMVWWVYHQALKAQKLSKAVVATDDERIGDVCKQYGIPFIMTSSEHRTGANRLWEVSEHQKADFYVAINGDEPLIAPQNIDLAIPEMVDQNIEYGTNIITKMSDPAQVCDTSNIKVVFDVKMKALYMSRTPIPFPFKSIDYTYYKHVGVLGYNKKMLDFYNNSNPGNLEIIEGIDTLRFIDYGKELQFIETDISESLSVDTPMDLEVVRKKIKALGEN